jgi:hypothetical protein
MDAAGDAEFSDFMHGRWAQLVRLGYGLTGDLQIAEDLAQTAASAERPQGHPGRTASHHGSPRIPKLIRDTA